MMDVVCAMGLASSVTGCHGKVGLVGFIINILCNGRISDYFDSSF